MDSIYNFLGKLAASMATRGWLQTIHKDSFSAFRAGRKGNALSPPSQKLLTQIFRLQDTEERLRSLRRECWRNGKLTGVSTKLTLQPSYSLALH